MALQTGFNLTASDMTSLLEKIDKQQSGVRTWRQLFGNTSLGYNAQSDALNTDYASAIAEAYKTNFARRNAILGSGLSTGSTQQLLSQNRADLHTAYETYVRNYGSAASSLAESYGKEIGELNTALTERAANFADLYNSAYKYLSEELYGTNYVNANNLAWTLNEGGALKTWDELAYLMFDNNRNLTAQGTEFFDQMFNATPQGYTRFNKDGEEVAVRTFDQWLNDTNPELRTWAAGADAFNYTRAGSNLGTAKALAGMESDDQKYHQSEYMDEGDATQIYDTGMSYLGYPTNVDRLPVQEKLAKAFDDYTKAKREYDKYEKGFYIGKNPYQQDLAKANTQYREAVAELNEYISKQITSTVTRTNENFTSYQTTLQTELGPLYSELINSSEYSSALNEYYKARDAFETFDVDKVDMSKFDNGNPTSYYLRGFKNTESNYREAYKNLMAVINNFVKSKQYTGKTSGL